MPPPPLLTIAASKGRLLTDALPLLAKIDCAPAIAPHQSRALILPTPNPRLRLIVVRAQDAPTYVSCGAADGGIVGGDVIAENPAPDIYHPLTLPIGQCRMVVAARDAAILNRSRLTVATKYPNTARAYFHRRGIRAHLIKLHGSLELAPLVNLADAIVDIAESGATLRANGLSELALIRPISAVFITNRVAARRNPQLAAFQRRLAAAAAEFTPPPQ